MIANNENDELSPDITEIPTAEYPVLSEDALARAAERNGADDAGSREPGEPVAAASSLAHLEAEVGRLHAKWQAIDAEFNRRETRIAQLNEERKASATKIAELESALERSSAELETAAQRLADKEREIEALAAAQRARDEQFGAESKKRAEAEAAEKEALERATRAEAEMARLEQAVLREEAANAGAAEHNRRLVEEQERWQAKVQDLEIYINGRHDRWAELNTELAQRAAALTAAEKKIQERDATIARHDEEKRQLAASIQALERQCAELSGRRMEREEAFEDLQRKLAAHFAEAERLKADFANRAKEGELAAKRALDGEQRVESVEREVKRRDEEIAALNAEIERGKHAVAALAAEKDALAKRVAELDKTLADRSQQEQLLRDDLRTSHHELRSLQEQLTDRTAQLGSSQDALQGKSRELEQLTDELHAARKASLDSRAELDALSAHAEELGRLRGEAAAEVTRLELMLKTEQERAANLETELRAKQATADLLERSVERISDLGASLAALDERMNGNAHDGDVSPAKFAETVAADDAVEVAAPALARPVDMLSIEAMFDEALRRDGREADTRGRPSTGRKLVVAIGGQVFAFPISKKHTTIGRGHGTDIRIASHFVSRVHATISLKGSSTIIEDAGSKNGLLVNSERVQRRVLRDGDVVTFGDDVHLRFVDTTH